MAAIRNDPCLAFLREADPERYLSCLYLPEKLRADAAAIFAFSVETARIAGLVSEPMPGEIRLQWWREVIGGEREHGANALAMRLLETVERHSLPREALIASLDARIFDLYHDPMPDRETLEAYCGETSSAIFRMVAMCAGLDSTRPLADACGHSGVAVTVARLLQYTAALSARQQCYLPADMLAATGLTVAEWLAEGRETEKMTAAAAFASLAKDHHRSALAKIALLPSEGRRIFLPLATVPAVLSIIAKSGSAIFRNVPRLSPIRQNLSIWRAAVLGYWP